MKDEARKSLAPVLYIPHGGGPLSLLGDKGHKHLISFLREIAPDLGNPAAILIMVRVVSKWEMSAVWF